MSASVRGQLCASVVADPGDAHPLACTLVLALLAVGMRLPHLLAPAAPDEAGYLLVAARAHPGGPFLYGDLWVDRPPLLIAFYAVADALGGLTALRVMALLPVAALVVAAGRAGHLLGGARGCVCAAIVATALSGTPVLGVSEVDGELLAAPLVMTSCAVGLEAVSRATRLHHTGSGNHRTGPLTMVVAGGTASCALLVKQNFVDAGVFLAVLVVAGALRHTLPRARAGILLGALVGGAALPLLAALAWATAWGSGPAGLWDALFAFRASSLHAIASQSASAPLHRALTLTRAGVGSGLALVLALFLGASMRRVLQREPIAASITAMVLASITAISLGGSYWVHYLIELIPAAALATGDLTGRSSHLRVCTAVAVAVAVSSAAVAVRGERAIRTHPAAAASCSADSRGAGIVGGWLREHAGTGDSAVTVYGGANTVLGSGLRVSYPYLWSLPVRTLDPTLRRLRASVSGAHAATWVVRTLPLHSWGLDSRHFLQDDLSDHYRSVATVCGHQILLRDDLRRPRRSHTDLTRSATYPRDP